MLCHPGENGQGCLINLPIPLKTQLVAGLVRKSPRLQLNTPERKSCISLLEIDAGLSGSLRPLDTAVEISLDVSRTTRLHCRVFEWSAAMSDGVNSMKDTAVVSMRKFFFFFIGCRSRCTNGPCGMVCVHFSFSLLY